MFALIHSYHDAGRARLECVQGCRQVSQRYGNDCFRPAILLRAVLDPVASRARSCDLLEVDLLWEQQSTQPDMSVLQVQPVPTCRIRLSVLNGTSGGNVKLEGVMVADSVDGSLQGHLANLH